MQLKRANHIRVKPLSVMDRRLILQPLQRTKPVRIISKPTATPRYHSRVVPPTKDRLANIRAVVRVPGAKASPNPIIEPIAALNEVRGSGKGRILVIVGNGPSHRDAPLDRLSSQLKIDIMSVNKPDPRLWPTHSWTFCDKSQLNRHRDLWDKYHGLTFNTISIDTPRPNGYRIRNISGKGFSHDLTRGFYIGRSSVYAAMQVAIWMAYEEVYIFGVDMTAVNGKLYPWGTNPDVDDKTRMARFKAEADSYEYAATHIPPHLRERFIFCSEFNPWPFVDKYRKLPHVEAVDIILQRAKIL